MKRKSPFVHLRPSLSLLVVTSSSCASLTPRLSRERRDGRVGHKESRTRRPTHKSRDLKYKIPSYGRSSHDKRSHAHSMVTRWQRRLQEDHRMKRENDDTSARCFRFARRVGSCLLRVVVHSLKPNEWLKPKEEKNKPEIINS